MKEPGMPSTGVPATFRNRRLQHCRLGQLYIDAYFLLSRLQILESPEMCRPGFQPRSGVAITIARPEILVDSRAQVARVFCGPFPPSRNSRHAVREVPLTLDRS